MIAEGSEFEQITETELDQLQNAMGEQDPWLIKQLEIFIQEVNQLLQQEHWKTELEEFTHNHTAFFAGDYTTFADGHYEVWESFKKFTESHLNQGCRTYPQAHYDSAYSAFINTAEAIYNGQVDLMLTGQTKNLMELVSSIEWFGPYMAKKNAEFEADYHASDKIQIKVPRRKAKKLRKLKTIKLISRPSTRYLDAVLAQPLDDVVLHDGQWHCIYCKNDNPRDAKSCLVCRIAPASESAESLLKRVRKAARVVSDFTKNDKQSSAKEVAKRWLGRATNVELVAHQLFADGREKDALKLLTCHSRVCLASRLRPIYLSSLNALATLCMCMGKWEKTEEYVHEAHVIVRGSMRVDSGKWVLPAIDPMKNKMPAEFKNRPSSPPASEEAELRVQFISWMLCMRTLHSSKDESQQVTSCDDYCLRFSEAGGNASPILMLRRRLTVLLEVYLSRKQHQHAAPLSKQLGCPVMESCSLLPMPLLCAACEQCATSVVEVLIAKKADVGQQDAEGSMSLHYAARAKSRMQELMKMLLDANADANAVDSDGCTALHYASSTGDSNVVALLLLYGGDTEIVDNYGAMASDYAAQIGDHETQLLLLNSANERLASASDEWVECFDEESGYPFWLNANTGETEWGDKETWAGHEAQVSQAMDLSVTDLEEVEDITLEDANRKAWRGVDSMRKSLRNLHELTTNLVQEEKETIQKTKTAAAKYEHQLQETKENMQLVSKQLSRAQIERKGLQRSRTELGMVPESEIDETKAAEVNKELEQTRSRELELQKELEELKAKFARDTELKRKTEREKTQAGINLEMKQHVAMKEKEKIIQAFKANLKTIDKVVSQERTRHRANLLKKLALRRRRQKAKGGGTPAGGLPTIRARPETVRKGTPPKRPHIARPNTTAPGIRSRLPKKMLVGTTRTGTKNGVRPMPELSHNKGLSTTMPVMRKRPKGVPPPPLKKPGPPKKGW